MIRAVRSRNGLMFNPHPFLHIFSNLSFSGCGPSGMFFLHALATRRKQLREQGDLKALEALPQVTVFETASSPGGVWRSNRGQGGNNNGTSTSISTNMYEGLWTNGHKNAMEFFDYTFEDHFKSPQPVFMPRKQILEYILKRVILHENIFQYVHFNTEVKSVSYDENIKQFVVKVQHPDGTSTTQYFDKCVWASGLNGKPKMVPSIMKKLSNFKGQIVHSSQMDSLGASVKGKNILLVGGNLSAEDLALSFIKLGVNKIYITSRNTGDIVHYTSSWPGDKVKVLGSSTACGSNEDGKTIRICKSNFDGTFEDDYHDIGDISIVVFCTGYEAKIDYLDSSLLPCWVNDSCETYTIEDENWEMEPHLYTDVLGHVKPSDELALPNIHMDRVLISNPNMFYIHEMAYYPLIEVDIAAWHCMAHITGDMEVPSQEEMIEQSRTELLKKMQDHWLRYSIDEEYWYEVEMRGSHLFDVEMRVMGDYMSGEIKSLAHKMNNAKYPLRLGSYDKLNEIGEKLAQMTNQDVNNRWNLDLESEDDRVWKTFRDVDPSPYASFMTGMKSTSLKGRWLEIDDEGNLETNVTATEATIDTLEQELLWQVESGM